MDEAAARDRRSQEIEKEYLSSLADLNVNSKPLINMLTILAEENVEYAPVIVKSVENHLAQVKQFMSIFQSMLHIFVHRFEVDRSSAA